VSLLNSYPDPSPSGIAAAVGSSDAGAAPKGFTFTPGHGTTAAATWTKDGAPTPAGCAVTYTAAPEGATPRVQMVTIGC
jgi:hypothetical protein